MSRHAWGRGGAACAILIAAWVISWGALSGERGGGGGSVMVEILCFFLMSDAFFCGVDLGGGGKIRSDLKNCNVSWCLGRGRLARESLANKWRGISDKMLVPYGARVAWP